MHEIFMQHCLDLAVQGWGKTMPNPMVGCVIVHEGKIIGKGFHSGYGNPHAEVEAIHSVIDPSLLDKSTLYVNLEPCNHQGKTPPCSELILKNKISQVVICNHDPNPVVNGSGIKKLEENGVKVISGILKEKGEFLNRRFFTFHQKKRPYVILKWAQTKDGFIDKIRDHDQAEIHAISGKESHQLSHQWRSEEIAILVGKNTVKNDDPQLTTRLVSGRNPVRIVIDKNLELHAKHAVFNTDAETIILNTRSESTGRNIRRVKIEENKFNVNGMLEKLFQLCIQSVIVEGGAFTLSQFIAENTWDEARVFISEKEWKEGLPAPAFNFTADSTSIIGNDKLKIYYHK